MQKTKIPKIGQPTRQFPEPMGNPIKCPRCGYDYLRIVGTFHQEGIDPRNLKLECGRCQKPFYVFTEGK